MTMGLHVQRSAHVGTRIWEEGGRSRRQEQKEKPEKQYFFFNSTILYKDKRYEWDERYILCNYEIWKTKKKINNNSSLSSTRVSYFGSIWCLKSLRPSDSLSFLWVCPQYNGPFWRLESLCFLVQLPHHIIRPHATIFGSFHQSLCLKKIDKETEQHQEM